MTTPSPIHADDRIRVLDALRGFALMGIMFVNMTWFTGYAVSSPEQHAALANPELDATVNWLVNVLVDSKFWTLFALLFGVGVAIQARRAAESGTPFAPRFFRRMLVLFAIGAAHAVFVWFGDIVSIYAAVGLFLLLFLTLSDRAVLGWGIALLVSPIVIGGIWVAIVRLTLDPGVELVNPGHGPPELLVSFSDGSWAEAFRANWEFLVFRWIRALYSNRFLALLGLFLIGMYAGRRRIFTDAASHTTLLAGVLVAGLVIGLPANMLLATHGAPLRPSTADQWMMVTLGIIGVPALALAWASAFLLLWRVAAARAILAPFSYAGRLSLTNYVLQSVVGVLLFYGCGAGWWGDHGVTWSIGYIVVMFALQSLASALWLHTFRFGPLEWIWRCLTYGRVLPIRR